MYVPNSIFREYRYNIGLRLTNKYKQYLIRVYKINFKLKKNIMIVIIVDYLCN